MNTVFVEMRCCCNSLVQVTTGGVIHRACNQLVDVGNISTLPMLQTHDRPYTFSASVRSLASCFAAGLLASKNSGTTGNCHTATVANGWSLASVRRTLLSDGCCCSSPSLAASLVLSLSLLLLLADADEVCSAAAALSNSCCKSALSFINTCANAKHTHTHNQDCQQTVLVNSTHRPAFSTTPLLPHTTSPAPGSAPLGEHCPAPAP